MADGDAGVGEDRLTIGEVARAAGLRPSAIRYYEKVGLLPGPPRSGGKRLYPRDVLTSLAVIKLAQAAGFTIREIGTLMTGFSDGTPASARWRSMAEEKLSEVEEQIQRWQAMKAVLEEGVRCGCLRIEDCRILERFL